ncbi:unnamed protein product [Paramecium sonneborni]|uniref:Uncharacterized protein n=1 Tax=Paramecium sonneborni TaxID=65129 RepID=A0A8S1M0H6_9CILI|nr:unnamed protein product [Paramecium sonneborni]
MKQQKLIYWVQQEILSPELLQYFDVSKIQEAIKGQLKSIKELKKDLSKHNKENTIFLLVIFENKNLEVNLNMDSIIIYNIGEYQISLFQRTLVEKQADYLFTNQDLKKLRCKIRYKINSNNVNRMIKLVNKSYRDTEKLDINLYVLIHQKLYMLDKCNLFNNIYKKALNEMTLVSYDDIKFMVPIKSVIY